MNAAVAKKMPKRALAAKNRISGPRSSASLRPGWICGFLVMDTNVPSLTRHGRTCSTSVRHGLCLMRCTALILLDSSWLRIIWTREGIKAVQHQNIVFHGVLKHVPWAFVDRLLGEKKGR